MKIWEALEGARGKKGIRLPEWRADAIIREIRPKGTCKKRKMEPYLYIPIGSFHNVPWEGNEDELSSDKMEVVE